MINLEHVVLASPEQMEFVIEGMRNPMNSWEKSDSYSGYDCGSCEKLNERALVTRLIQRGRIVKTIIGLNLVLMTTLSCRSSQMQVQSIGSICE